MKLEPYNVLILKKPKEENEDTTILFGPELMLAWNQEQAKALAARKLTDEQMKDFPRVEILIRPF